MSIAQDAAKRLRKAQAIPGMEQADPEFSSTEEHEIFAPGFGRFQKKSIKRETLQYIDKLRAAIAIDHWREAANLSSIVESLIAGMKNYIEGKTPVQMGEPSVITAELDAGTPAEENPERMAKASCPAKPSLKKKKSVK